MSGSFKVSPGLFNIFKCLDTSEEYSLNKLYYVFMSYTEHLKGKNKTISTIIFEIIFGICKKLVVINNYEKVINKNIAFSKIL